MAKKKTTKGAAQVEEQVQETPEVSEQVVEAEVPAETETTESADSVEGGSEESEASEASEEETIKKPGREPEVPGSITKFFKFEPTAARTFDLDGGFVKVTLEKRIRVKAFVSDESTISFGEIIGAIEDKIRRLRGAIDIAPAKAPKGFFMVGRGYPITDIFVPLTRNSSRTIDNIKSILVNLGQELKGVTLRYKIETVAKITVDTSKEHKNVFLKGFLAGAVTAKKSRQEETIELIPEFRGQLFMDKAMNFEIRDIMNMNEVIEVNKVRLYENGDERNIWEYYLPLSKMMAITSYQISDTTSKGKLKVNRVLARIRIRNVSVAGIVVPVGVFISMRKDVISAKKIENFLVDVNAEGKNTSFLQTYGDMPVDNFVEYASLKQDFDVIDKVIIDSLEESKPAEEEAASEENA